MWSEAQRTLEDLLLEEDLPTQENPMQVSQGLAVSFLKYLQVLRSLEAWYEQLVQPQKRRTLRALLEALMGRLLELKSLMVEVELSEVHCFDDLLLVLKMMPKDLEVPIPRYFMREKMQVMKDREEILAHILNQQGLTDQETPRDSACSKQMSLDEALRVLQACERARQGRLRAGVMDRFLQRDGLRRPTVAQNPDRAATRIQKVWRGFSQRKQTEQERTEEMIFLGMLPRGPPAPGAALLQAQRSETRRRLLQEQKEAEYQGALLSIRESVRTAEETDLKENLQEQIRQWFNESRDATGKFPDFPDAEDGGSASVFAEKTPEQVAAELRVKDEQREKKKNQKKKKKQGKNEKKKKKAETEERAGWTKPASCFLPAVLDGVKLYEDVWQGRDESLNLQQHFDAQIVKEETRKEVELEVRVQVDELMREELKALKLKVDYDKGKKKKKKKKSKKSSKKKKKKEKDLTADRSLCEELLLQGVWIRPMNIKLADYIGDFGYYGNTLRQAGVEPVPSPSDVRQLVALYGVLPLGCAALAPRAPQVKSLLLAGPAGVGKKMLVHAVCTETGANLFNLSPANLRGKNLRRHLLHRVLQVALQLQPSVIWFGDAEETFSKKVPKLSAHTHSMELKKMKKDLPKVLKLLKPEDRVLLVGTSRRPFDADMKPFCKVYEKIVLIPRPDYASRLVLWEEFLRGRGAEPGPALDLSSLAKITDGYTQGHILEAVRSVLRPLRLNRLHTKPLTAAEFIAPLARLEPVYKEEEEAFKCWYSRTPLCRRKSQAAKISEEEEAGKRKNGRGEKKKKSKDVKNKTMKKMKGVKKKKK
ncbi:dynein regulatory complex protein 11 [Genypterus blacodes]|uniref:dynein regulatory complex protein 11 n=1 Tax=Genypterus blacodes TaxID=154954 RepID=UPI003F77293A